MLINTYAKPLHRELTWGLEKLVFSIVWKERAALSSSEQMMHLDSGLPVLQALDLWLTKEHHYAELIYFIAHYITSWEEGSGRMH